MQPEGLLARLGYGRLRGFGMLATFGFVSFLSAVDGVGAEDADAR